MSSYPVYVRNLARNFGDRPAIRGVDLEIAAGEFVALIGRSGSGKSTLIRALADLDHDVAGSGTLVVPQNLALVFQDARLLPWQRVLSNVIFGLHGPDAASRGRAALEEVELAARARAWPYELSGGEQQRVALARAIVREPAFLLADEPFGALDALTRIRMHHLMRKISARHGPAVLMVTHDVDEAIELAERVLVLEAGRIIANIEIKLPPDNIHLGDTFAAYRTQLLELLGVEDSRKRRAA
jgi:sulfonate transport system ATP-binding protein